MTIWHVITAIIVALIVVVLLLIISTIMVLAGTKDRTISYGKDIILFQTIVYRKHSSLSQKINIDHPDYYSDLRSSEIMNENQVSSM